MKAKIVSIVDLKKTVAEREAEQLLTQLKDDPDKAIEVVLESSETPYFPKGRRDLGENDYR